MRKAKGIGLLIKKYAEEHPTLLARLDELEDERQQLIKSNTIMNAQLEHFKQREKQQRIELESRNKEIFELKDTVVKYLFTENACQEQIKNKESDFRLYKEQNNAKLLNLQYDVIESRNELAHIIGLVKSNFSATLGMFCKAQLSNLAQSLSAKYEERLSKYKAKSENVFKGKETVLSKEIESLKIKLSESNTRCDRLLQDIQVFKKEQAEHLSGQKLYTQGQELSMERSKLDQERRRLLDLCNELKEKEYTSNADLEKKVLMLQGENVKLEEQMVALEKTIRELNASLTNARIERNQTIEAHQSRIKQLQEKFLEDLKRESDTKVEQVELNLRKTLAKENELALEHLKEQLEQEFAETKGSLVKQIELLKSHNINIQLKMEEKWNSREQDIQKHLKELSDRFMHEKSNYQSKISELNKKITEELSNKSSSPLEDQLIQLQSKLSKKETEIAFLKDTVRVECEERMGLVAMVAKLQKELQSKSPEMKNSTIMEVESVKSEKEKPKHAMSEKDTEFFKLIQNANLKNSKRLAKQKIK
ncbi:hypothetical protein HK103_005176 [Boothiomyces macroporosus]|uniref:Uncharacterized protein n=1 Tax=Boothiomyces macroporosus TaxID=261099 RepID=A0AAD5Y2V5_9FUNG|nr:hypothetical protein HK103_005176 [Boothiomyces macroporosus]